jgi:hypothetical protein
MYVFPKYFVYVIFAFALPFIASLSGYGVSVAVFGINNTDITIATVLNECALTGLYYIFFVTLQLFVGITSGKAGITALIMIVGNMFMPMILAAAAVESYFNPFALQSFSVSRYYGDATYTNMNFYGTIIITVILSLIWFFAALFFKTAAKVDNSGGSEDIAL